MNAKTKHKPGALIEATPLPVRASDNPNSMLALAIEQKMDAATIKDMMDLRDRWEAGEARKAFVQAMADFKANPPEILKKKLVKFETQSGTTSYSHAELADVTEAILQPLAAHGFSHRWEVKQDNAITVTCVLTHRQGHSESVTLSSPPDDSGKKNKIQQVASTITYLQRYTLLAITGLAAKGMDNDGGPPEIERITEDQASNLQALIDEVGADKAKFLKYLKVDSLEDIAAQAYSDAVHALERKRK